MYALSVILHCFVGMAVTGAAAAQSEQFRHALIALGLGSAASLALKALGGYTLALLPRAPDEQGRS
jgi:hypothetical protein